MSRQIRRTAAVVLALTVTASAAAASELRFVTGPQGGSWYPLGGAMKGLIEKVLPGTNVSIAPGAGIGNTKLIHAGRADIGFGNSATTVDAINGGEVFEGVKHTNVCNVGSLYPQFFQIVATKDSGITSGSQVAGRSLTTQKRGNTGELMTREWLQVNNVTFDNLRQVNQGSYNDSVNQLKDGNAEFFTLVTQVPAGAIMDIASARDITIVGMTDAEIEAMQKINPGYQKIMIKAGSYPKQDADVATVGFWTHVIVRCDMDEATVYGITKAMIEGLSDLGTIAKAITEYTPAEIAQDVGVPMHPGALKYYKEKGIL
ncbi:MAG: TAXI family TRAP transporter solute-binding subunit [Hyphomicrobiaceae bacterium]